MVSLDSSRREGEGEGEGRRKEKGEADEMGGRCTGIYLHSMSTKAGTYCYHQVRLFLSSFSSSAR